MDSCTSTSGHELINHTCCHYETGRSASRVLLLISVFDMCVVLKADCVSVTEYLEYFQAEIGVTAAEPECEKCEVVVLDKERSVRVHVFLGESAAARRFCGFRNRRGGSAQTLCSSEDSGAQSCGRRGVNTHNTESSVQLQSSRSLSAFVSAHPQQILPDSRRGIPSS